MPFVTKKEMEISEPAHTGLGKRVTVPIVWDCAQTAAKEKKRKRENLIRVNEFCLKEVKFTTLVFGRRK